MAYDAPTAAEVKARFPEFASVDDDLVDAVVVEANRFVDDSWIEADYKPALIFLTAHMLAMDGYLSGGPAVGNPGPVTSEKLGDASVTYGSFQSSQEAGAGTMELNSTPYGRRFATLRRVNRSGPRTAI